jgi:hypothetical protein
VSEDRILELTLLANEQTATYLQWWLSISIGLVALAHFAIRKINLPIVVFVSALYVAHTVNTARGLFKIGGINRGATLELEQLADSGNASQITEAFLEAPSAILPLYGFAFAGTFLGTLWFLVYCYLRVRNEKK